MSISQSIGVGWENGEGGQEGDLITSFQMH